jgi:DNA-directed RNA polymerase II subunit RPB1
LINDAAPEVRELMMVPKMIVSPQANKPVMGIVQDTLLGSRKFTQRDIFLERAMFFNMLMWMSPWDGKVPQPAIMVPSRASPGRPRALWTGKQAVSCFTPDVNYQHGKLDARETNCWSGDDCVLVVKGEYLMGIMAKYQLGNKMQGLLHIIMNDVSPEVTRDFINNCQKVINYWLLHRGFSVGIGDAEADLATLRAIEREARTKMEDGRSVANGLKLEKARATDPSIKTSPLVAGIGELQRAIGLVLMNAPTRSAALLREAEAAAAHNRG